MLGMFRSRYSVHARSGAGGGVRFTGGTPGQGGSPPWTFDTLGVVSAIPEPPAALTLDETGEVTGGV